MTGKVKWFNENKGYGFIAKEDGKDLFVHINDIKEHKMPKEGQAVMFDVGHSDKGDKAINVMILE